MVKKPNNTLTTTFNNYVDKMRGGGGQKMSVFVHAHGIKSVNSEKREGGSKNDKILSTWLLNDPL